MSSSDGLNILYSILTVLGSVSAVIFCIAIGWFLIWKLFLSRFEFIREIVNSGAEEHKSRRAPSIGKEQAPLRRSKTSQGKKNNLFNMSEGDDEKREGVLRSGKFYFDRAWNDPPEFKYDAQARAAAATATRGTGGGMKLNKRVGHALKPGSLPPPPLGTSPVKMDGDVPAVPNLQDAGARSLADMPPPPPPLSASQKSRPNSHFDVQAASSTATDDAFVDVETCVANLETVVDKNANFTDVKRKDIQKRIGMMAAKWKSGNLNKNVEIGMGRVSQLLMESDATGADKILQSMMVDYSSHCTPWAVGIKHLIASAKPTGIGETPQKGIENPL